MENEEILEEIKQLKKQIDELGRQVIDFKLPKNYEQMSEEEKKAYQKRQEQLKKQALKELDNYSVVLNDYTMVSYPKNKNIVVSFLRDVGSLSSIPLERDTFKRTIPEKFKELHKKNLEEIEAQIERYNSTKAIRNDRIEFGPNFNNFIETYFSKIASINLDRMSNKYFLKEYDRQLDKNGNVIGDQFKFQNLTDDQKKALIKIRIKMFAEKLDKLQRVAETKVRQDSKQKMETYLEKYGFLNNQTSYRNGSKKFTTVKSVVSASGLQMDKMKLVKGSELFSKTKTDESRDEKNKARLIELNVMREKFDNFVKFYKGNGRQFAIEFEQNFPEIADKLYNQKVSNALSFRSQNLSSSPISVQEHEIEKQFDEELRKVNFRLRYRSFYIPASVSVCTGFLGKQLTNAKTQTEKNLDAMKVKEYDRELKNISLREDLIGYESIFESLNSNLQKEFTEYIQKDKKNFDKKSESSKKSELKKFIADRIEKLEETVHRNKFFSLGTEKLERLSGILIDRDEKIASREIKNVVDTLGQEQGELYKRILQSVKELNAKYIYEKSVVDKLSENLESYTSKPYSYENNNQMQKIIKDINSHNKKMAIIKSSLDSAMQRKVSFENNFASQQISKAITSESSKAVSFNTSKSVLDKYAFPAVDAFGEVYYIEKGTIEGKQIEKIVASFIMNFKNQVQNMKATFAGTNCTEIIDYIAKLEDKLEDDFGSNIRDLKKTQKFFKSQMEGPAKSYEEAIINELEKYNQRLTKIESDLIKKLKSMNVEIGDVTLAKNKK